MSPREALSMLDQLAANFQGNRQEYINLQGAIAVLRSLVFKAEAEIEHVAGEVEDAAEKAVDAAEK